MKHSPDYIQSLRMKSRTTQEERLILFRAGVAEVTPGDVRVRAESNEETMDRVLGDIREVFGRR